VTQVEELEAAILARAQRLANEYQERAERSRDNVLREAADRLRIREEREEAIAKALADRAYRQQVQANELKLQSQLDQVRWNLVRSVEERLEERMRAYAENGSAYLDTIKRYLAQASAEIERDELVAEVNAHDLKRLQPLWDDLAREAAPNKRVQLSPDPIDTLGGIVVRSTDNRIRVDHSFEGRRARLRNRIFQVVLERLLPGGYESTPIFNG